MIFHFARILSRSEKAKRECNDQTKWIHLNEFVSLILHCLLLCRQRDGKFFIVLCRRVEWKIYSNNFLDTFAIKSWKKTEKKISFQKERSAIWRFIWTFVTTLPVLFFGALILLEISHLNAWILIDYHVQSNIILLVQFLMSITLLNITSCHRFL